MQSQARTLDASALIDRMNRSPGVLLSRDASIFETNLDRDIHVLEGALAMQRGRMGSLLQSARRWRAKGDLESCRRNIAAVKQCRKTSRDMADRLDALIAKRDRKVK